jgi:hypothetical protein
MMRIRWGWLIFGWLVMTAAASELVSDAAGLTVCFLPFVLLGFAWVRRTRAGRAPADLHPALVPVYESISGRNRSYDAGLLALGLVTRDDRGRVYRPGKVEYASDSYAGTVVFSPRQTGRVGDWVRHADELRHLWRHSDLQIFAEAGLVAVALLHTLPPDPLEEPIILDHVPPPPDGDVAVLLGVDEVGENVCAGLQDRAGVVVGGQPGSGKTAGMQQLLAPLMQLPTVQFAVVDGKGGHDWANFGDRAFVYTSTAKNLQKVVDLLESIEAERERRLVALPKIRGSRSFWDDGPGEDLPLIVVVIDEVQVFTDKQYLTTKDDKALGDRITGLVKSLVALGRSAGIVTILATQRPTFDSIPIAARDNSNLRLCWAVATWESARAVLGDRPDQVDPSTPPPPAPLGQPQGVLVAFLGAGKLVRLRSPFIPERIIAELASATACVVCDPRKRSDLGITG